MKLTLVLLTLCAIANAAVITHKSTGIISPLNNGLESRAYEEQLKIFLEKVRKMLVEGIPELEIPPLEPYLMAEVHIDEDIPDIGIIKMDAKDITVRGVTGFVVNHISLDVIRMRLDFDYTMPSIKVFAELYELVGKIYGMDIFGEGVFDVEALDLNFSGFGTITVKDGFLFMNRLEIKVVMDAFKSNISGLLGGGAAGDALNKLIEEKAPSMMEAESEKVSAFVSRSIVNFANHYLTKMTFKDLIDLITGGSGGGN